MSKTINDGYSMLLEEHDAERVELNPTRDETGAPAPEPDVKTATHDGAGWYTLSDSDEKIRGKDAVLEAGYTISEG